VLSVFSGYIFGNSIPHFVFYRIFTVQLKYVCWKDRNENNRFIDVVILSLGFSIHVALKLKLDFFSGHSGTVSLILWRILHFR
jgi:hypothetical protein